MKFLAIKIGHIPTEDLYYLKTVCLDSERRGYHFAPTFWSSLKIPKPIVESNLDSKLESNLDSCSESELMKS